MQHGKFFVDIVNKHGKPVAQKRREEIDKTIDLYHSVHILLVTPDGRLVVSTIPARKDLPNLYANQYGATIATIRRSGESPAKAAVRALSNELFMEGAKLYDLGEKFQTFRDGHQTYLSVFYVIAEAPETYSHVDISKLTVATAGEVTAKLADNPEAIAPTLQRIWEEHAQDLPLQTNQ